MGREGVELIYSAVYIHLLRNGARLCCRFVKACHWEQKYILIYIYGLSRKTGYTSLGNPISLYLLHGRWATLLISKPSNRYDFD